MIVNILYKSYPGSCNEHANPSENQGIDRLIPKTPLTNGPKIPAAVI